MPDKFEHETIKQLLDSAENQIRQAKSILFATEINKKAKELENNDSGDVIEGVFNGEVMVGPDDKVYHVPANYASKSKLIPGDVLKLTIISDGSFIFKQIGPIKRKKVIGVLEDLDKGRFAVDVEGKKYRVLYASVSYFKAKDGDKLTVVVPEKGESEWAAIENVIE